MIVTASGIQFRADKNKIGHDANHSTAEKNDAETAAAADDDNDDAPTAARDESEDNAGKDESNVSYSIAKIDKGRCLLSHINICTNERVTTNLYMFVCLFVCMYVCIYICMYTNRHQ